MIGVDFGTTNSCVAIRDAFGSIESVLVATGNRPPYDTVLRSAVLNPEDAGRSVGEEALQRAEAAPAGSRLLVSFKPFLDEHQLRRMERRVVGQKHTYDPLEEAELIVPEYASVWVGGEERYSRGELISGTAAMLGHLLFSGPEGIVRQRAQGLMYLTLARESANDPANDKWIVDLYEKAMRDATDNDRQAAAVYLEGYMKKR